MIPARTMKPGEGIYTFVCNDGENVNIASNRLHDWCQNNPALEVQLAPVHAHLAKQFITDNAISLDRCKELIHRFLKRQDIDPIIFCKDGTFGANGVPNVLLVDGHHRYFIHWALRIPLIKFYGLEVEQWRPFQIDGLPDLTKRQLRNIPILARNY